MPKRCLMGWCRRIAGQFGCGAPAVPHGRRGRGGHVPPGRGVLQPPLQRLDGSARPASPGGAAESVLGGPCPTAAPPRVSGRTGRSPGVQARMLPREPLTLEDAPMATALPPGQPCSLFQARVPPGALPLRVSVSKHVAAQNQGLLSETSARFRPNRLEPCGVLARTSGPRLRTAVLGRGETGNAALGPSFSPALVRR